MPLIQLSQVSLAYGHVPLLDQVDLVIEPGERIGLIGRNGTGKSSLLNALLQEDRAIVTPLPGTTRDVLEETVNVKGVPVRIMDTAGLRSPQDPVEREGVRRTLRAVESADLVLAVFDLSEPLQPEDLEVMAALREKQTLVILNKADQICRLDAAASWPRFGMGGSCRGPGSGGAGRLVSHRDR